MNFKLQLFFTVLLTQITVAQNKVSQDSIFNDGESEILEELIITGQHNPQSVNKSIYEVKVINREAIERLAGNTIADVLNQSLNINIQPNSSDGKSKLNMLGFGSSYIKVLVDNIPIVNDENFGSNTDLTQLNLDDIERIEIVEGAMGVDYGANSLSGVINIITRKKSRHSWEITPTIQEETIGSEYNWNTRGRHIQGLKVAKNISDDFYVNATYNRNNFNGFWGNRKGIYHIKNDELRGYEWLPKKQNTYKLNAYYNGDKQKIFFKSEYFNEKVNFVNKTVNIDEHPQTDTKNYYGTDKNFSTERYFSLLNATGTVPGDWFSYDVSVSFQKQTKNQELYRLNIVENTKHNVSKNEFESRKVIYSKGLFSNFTKNRNFDYQLGYEINQIHGYTSIYALANSQKDINKTIGSYDFFLSSEVEVSDKLSFRPGYRLMTSSMFDSQHIYSLSAKYLFPNGYNLRTIVGSSARIPSYDELYTYMVDSNHNIQGNPDLNSEKGFSAFVHLNKNFDSKDNDIFIKNTLSLGMVNLRDEIGLIETAPNVFKFANFDKKETNSISYMGELRYKNLTLGLGVSYIGILQKIKEYKETNHFLYTLNSNTNISYSLPEYDTTFSFFYKLNGERQRFILKNVTVGNNPIPTETKLVKGILAPIQWVDATIQKKFFNKKIDVTVGVRNLFNVVRVDSTAETAGAHQTPETSLLMGYGRSVFLKLSYNITL